MNSANISTFSTIAPPLHQSLPDALAHFQHNVEKLSRQYETVLRQEVDERDQGICESIISDAESILNDEDRLLTLPVSHRKYPPWEFDEERSILREAVAYDSSQLVYSVSNEKTLSHYFDRCQSFKPNGLIKTLFWQQREARLDADTHDSSNEPSPSSESAELALL